MKKLIFKSTFYLFAIIVCLEILIRVFYLGKDNPSRFLDDKNVEKWVPNQKGFSVTGNRRQNFSEYRINKFGFNSYREFTPSKDQVEIALVGDSFIQGFHQNYYDSTGKKIELILPEINVYEFGYAGYDFADQLHLIDTYKDMFDLIDHTIIGLDFYTDLDRAEYNVIYDRLGSEAPLKKLLKKSKLIVYTKEMGILKIPKKLISKVFTTIYSINKKAYSNNTTKKSDIEKDTKNTENFKSLVAKYNYDKDKFILLLDRTKTPDHFLTYLKQNSYNYIEFGITLKNAEKPTTLIYDQHWNNYGRKLVSEVISDYLKKIL